MKTLPTQRSAFSLLEIIIATGIVVILLVAVFVYIRPGEELAAARNARRFTDAEAIATAATIQLSKGKYVAGADRIWRMIGSATDKCSRRCGDLKDGSEGTAVFFPGRSDIGLKASDPAVADFYKTDHFSISFWVRTFEINGLGGIVGKFGGGVPAYGYSVAIGNLYTVQNGQATVTGATVLDKGRIAFNAHYIANPAIGWRMAVTQDAIVEANKYYHIVLTYDGGLNTVKFFVDGNEVPVVTGVFDLFPPNTIVDPEIHNPSMLTLGHFAGIGLFQSLKGKFDDLQMFSRVLTPDEVLKLYDGEDVTDGLIAKWDFNDGSGKFANAKRYDQATSTFVDYDQYDLSFPDTLPTNPPMTYSQLWDDDEPLLPYKCLDIGPTLVGKRLSKIPVSPIAAGSRYQPDPTRSFYAMRYSGSVLVRSCLSEQENNNGVISTPVIEVAR